MNAENELTEKNFRRNETFILKTCEALADYICANKSSFRWKKADYGNRGRKPLWRSVVGE